MSHRPESVSRAIAPRVQRLAVVAAAIATAAAITLGFWSERNKADEAFRHRTGHGIAGLEFAFSGEKAAAILSRCGDGCPALAREVVRRDLRFTFSYALALTLVGVLLSWLLRKDERALAPILCGFPLLAAAAECAADLSVLGILGGGESPAGALVLLAGVASSIKVALLVGALGAIVWSIVRIARSAAPALANVVRFGDVRQAEAGYLAERRRRAGLVPASSPESAAFRPIGLALSGGGVRSATFNLGILQALCALGVLPRIDYLSTVSGGGYIGSCLSSLLSRMRTQDGQASEDENDAYVAARNDGTARFGTRPADFPFHPEADEQPGLGAFNGRAEVRHLRTHGDFLIVRRKLFSRDVLRTVGTLAGGVFYHLLLFSLFLVAASALYFAAVCAMAGDLRRTLEGVSLSEYVSRLLAWPTSGGLMEYPLFVSFVLGAVITLVSLYAVGFLLHILPDRTFYREGLSVEDQREISSLRAHVVITLSGAAMVTACFVIGLGPMISHLALPLGFYLGGQSSAIVLHAVVAMMRPATRNDRSRFAAAKGVLNYLTAASFGVVLLPYVVYTLALPRLGMQTGFGWLASLVLTRLLARRAGGESAVGVGDYVRRLLAFPMFVRRAILTASVVVLVIGGVVLVCSAIVRLQPAANVPAASLPFAIGLFALATFGALGTVLNFNELSLHYFYRDRLVESYLQTYAPVGRGAEAGVEIVLRDDSEMPLTHLHGCRLDAAGKPLPDCVTSAPYQLLVTSINLTASRDMTRRDRKSDHFIFSKLFCGSETTGYVPTSQYRGGETKLARAMTISGAAASSAIGRQTFFAQALALTLFDVRLGQWMENPRFKEGSRAHGREGGVFWPYYLLREMLGSTDASRRLVNLSDGGHTGDNLGIVPLLRRRCAVIVACDAEADPAYAFGSLTEALRQIYVDENIKVDLVVDRVRPDRETALSASHFAVGRIRYPKTPEHPNEEVGWLLLLKSSLTGDEMARIENYKQENPAFPQQPTSDQFFDDDQFESYRELGYHVATTSLRDVSDMAWQPSLGREWEACWEQAANPER